MKIGIFGGSFNPPHNGHLHLATSQAKQLGLGKVLIVPCFIPPHKQSGDLADSKHRLNMCKLAFPSPLFEVSSIEIDREKTSYTVETLREIKKRYPNDELYFMVGSDMLSTFQQWYRWEEILQLAKLSASSRAEGFKPKLEQFTPEQRERVIYLDFQPLEISSTQLRLRIKSNYNCEEFLHKEVLNYIAENSLYDDEFDSYRETLSKMLDSRRLYHSECVSESAGYLAEKYGADATKAKLAGLLHDITKLLCESEHLALMGDCSEIDIKSKKVWHQISAPQFLRENKICLDEEILSAIRWHTTGKGSMTLLEKILYVADFISADRDYPDVSTVRALSEISLEHAMLYTARYTVISLAKRDSLIHPASVECYNDMLKHFKL